MSLQLDTVKKKIDNASFCHSFQFMKDSAHGPRASASRYFTLFKQLVPISLFQSLFSKQSKRKKNGQTKKRKREFLMNYTISVKLDSRKPVPEKKKIYLSTHFN